MDRPSGRWAIRCLNLFIFRIDRPANGALQELVCSWRDVNADHTISIAGAALPAERMRHELHFDRIIANARVVSLSWEGDKAQVITSDYVLGFFCIDHREEFDIGVLYV